MMLVGSKIKTDDNCTGKKYKSQKIINENTDTSKEKTGNVEKQARICPKIGNIGIYSKENMLSFLKSFSSYKVF